MVDLLWAKGCSRHFHAVVTIKGLLERIIIRILTTTDSWQVMLYGLNDLPMLLVEGTGASVVSWTHGRAWHSFLSCLREWIGDIVVLRGY